MILAFLAAIAYFVRSQGFIGDLGDESPTTNFYFGKVGDGQRMGCWCNSVYNSSFRFLCGGNKSTQKQDINKAKEYWADYARRQT